MKISIISSCIIPCNPRIYGSEAINAFLADELAKRHDVTIYAPGNSIIERARHRLIQCTYGLADINVEYREYRYYEGEFLDYDYIIDMSASCIYTERLFFRHKHDFNGKILWFRNGVSFAHPRPPVNQKVPGVCLSKIARKIAIEKYGLPGDNIFVIYYGLPRNLYPPCYDKDDYILYLSRPHPDKGIFTFLEIAKRMPNQKFILAYDPLFEEHRMYHERVLEIVRQLDNVEYIPLNFSLERKIEVYQKAKALLIPLNPSYIEAFGLVFIEALSSATPVITASHGSTSEIINDGETGFLCSSLDEYIEAIRNIDDINPEDCRAEFLRRFTIEKMAMNYERVYDLIKPLGEL